MMTFVSSPTNINFYVNGTLAQTSIEPFTATDTMSSPTAIFNYAVDSGLSTFISMSLAHIMFYSSSLSQTEVTQNYNALRGRYGI
jgi:hypothetical protein